MHHIIPMTPFEKLVSGTALWLLQVGVFCAVSFEILERFPTGATALWSTSKVTAQLPGRAQLLQLGVGIE